MAQRIVQPCQQIFARSQINGVRLKPEKTYEYIGFVSQNFSILFQALLFRSPDIEIHELSRHLTLTD